MATLAFQNTGAGPYTGGRPDGVEERNREAGNLASGVASASRPVSAKARRFQVAGDGMNRQCTLTPSGIPVIASAR
jgi:hypothetical protein